jgi:hypothetical protein
MGPFEDMYYDDRPVKLRRCDCAGCASPGDYRAPKNRELTQHYWFCLEHLREYNRNWDFFAGMSGGEIESYIRTATVWERPSWPLGDWHAREQSLRDHVVREFFEESAFERSAVPPMPKAEREALTALELNPPVTFADIKAQYRLLVKRHHPDANAGSIEAEEKFKSINQAFTMLKQIYSVDEEV